MKKATKKNVAIGVVIIAVLAVAGGYYYASTSAEPVVTETVTSAPVEKKDITIALAADGKAAYAVTNLKFSGSGVLQELYVKEGQEVQQGDVLAKLDSQNLQNQVKQAQANYNIAVEKYNKLLAGPSDPEVQSKQVAVDNAEANLRVEQSLYNYKISLYNDGKLTESDILSEELKLEGAKAQLASAQAQLALVTPADAYDLTSAQESVKQMAANLAIAKKNLSEATLTAPSDGIIFEINSNVGEFLSSGGNSFIQLGAKQPTVEASVIEEDISKIAVGQVVDVEFIALPDQVFSGKVSSIAPNSLIDQSGIVTYQVVMTLDQADNAIKNGMTASIAFVSQQAKDVLTVPVEAVKRLDGVAKVELSKSDGTSEFVTVKTGLTDGKSVEIKEGLQEGDKVIIRKAVKK